ncbi:hypothetical protein PPYR_01217 [Photinus pyralis]|uniref:PiggyBac transposable element-derived protein domain-containing protein n=1 Tax=Photinus pyralis TaxID=7054 RepID=A0A5N4B3R0_PHOPY|nr:hypothetical protein PPYR_01217 [Photinus pyralis]
MMMKIQVMRFAVEDETRSEDTDTEQEIDSDENNSEEETDANIDRHGFSISWDGTIWNKHYFTKKMRRSKKNIVTQLPGTRGAARNIKDPFGIWSTFFNNKIMSIIVENTNKYLASRAANYDRDTYTRSTNIPEIHALLGILLLSGVKKNNHLNAVDLFKTNGTVPEIYRLRFDDLETREARQSIDKLAPIRDLFEEFVENCKGNYSLSHSVTIDEKLEAFRGRCSFRQYIPSKPSKYGIKIFALCDARMYYTANLEVYVGTQPEGPYSTNNSALSVVERLCKPIRGTGRNLTMDNWFTSLELAESLLKQNHWYYPEKQTLLTVRIYRRKESPHWVKYVWVQNEMYPCIAHSEKE